MLQKSDETTALSILDEGGPDVAILTKAYERTLAGLAPYFRQCQKSFDERRNFWSGKAEDLRKNGADAFPWKGASDMEANVISERINTYIALCMTALARANINAYPVEAGDMARAKVQSSFLKWMISTYIPRFKQEMELVANYGFERGIMVTYVGWDQEKNKYLQSFSLDAIAQAAPELAKMIMDPAKDKEVIEGLRAIYPDVKESRAKKALKDLRTKGTAELPVVKREVDRPCVRALAPDGDILFPPYTTDPQRAPYVFYRVRMTIQEVLNKVETAGWDADWADYIIEHFHGVDTFSAGEPQKRTNTRNAEREAEELIDIVYGYQRLVDKSDGSQGIYYTVFHPSFSGKNEIPGYGKHELLNGHEDYPFAVTKLSEDNNSLYDLQTVPEILRGPQWQVKIERDSRIDANSMRTMPPLMHPMGKPPPDWGPGRKIGRMRPGDYEWADVPQLNPGSVEVEQTLLLSADKLMGLDYDNPLSGARRQYFIDKFLGHVRDVVKMAYKAYQRYGPDEVFFRVTGVPDPQRFNKGNPDEDFDAQVMFDVQNTDPETLQKKMEQMAALIPIDRNGRINMDAYVEFGANAIDPMLADAVLQPAEAAQQKMVKDVTDDLTKIYSGIEVGARPNGAQVALAVIQQYAQQPDVAQRLTQDKAFAERLEKYAKQYAFAIQQVQNAEIGKVGTSPAAVGNIGTQTANTQSYS